MDTSPPVEIVENETSNPTLEVAGVSEKISCDIQTDILDKIFESRQIAGDIVENVIQDSSVPRKNVVDILDTILWIFSQRSPLCSNVTNVVWYCLSFKTLSLTKDIFTELSCTCQPKKPLQRRLTIRL